MARIREHALPYLLITGVWSVVLALVDHGGEFPLIDDWAYAHGVSDLLEHHRLKISDWVAMTQVAHLLLGAMWSAWFGFSLQALREMTLLIGFLGSFVLFGLTRHATASLAWRLVGTLLVTVNPIWIYLCHTFMTDIPFTVLFLALIAGCLHLLRSGKPSPLLAASVLTGSVILVLIRQTGLGLGFSLLAWLLLAGGGAYRRWVVPAVVLTLTQVATLVGYDLVMQALDAMSTRYHGASALTWILDRPWWPVRAAYYMLIQVHHLGMFLLPLLPLVYLRFRSDPAGIGGPRSALLVAGALTLAVLSAVGGDILMNPRHTHLMQYDTVGHVMLIDFTYERLSFSRVLYPLWVVLSLLGSANIFFGTVLLLRHARTKSLEMGWIGFILLGYTVFIAIGQFVFDRYLMLSLPLAMAYLLRLTDGPPTPKTAVVLSAGFLVLSLAFGTIGTRDSFEWNRTRFQALSELESAGISPHEIDGGAEYNSWKRTAPLQPLRMNGKSWWYVDGDTYAIAHQPIPGYERIAAYPFTRYFGLVQDTLYVVRRP